MEKLLKIKEAADLLGLSHWFISKAIRQKKLVCVRLSREATRIRPSDLEKFVKNYLAVGSNVASEPVKDGK